MKRVISSFITIVAVSTTSFKKARKGNILYLLTTTTPIVAILRSSRLDLTTDVAKLSLYIRGASYIGAPTRTRNRNTKRGEGEKGSHCRGLDGRERR